MNEPNEHERVIQLLREARLPAEEITPEHLEENLRWLVRLARPEVQAPEQLRDRGRAPARRPVGWWYRAPDRYREDVGPARSNEDVFPFLLVVRGDKNVLTRRSAAGPARRDVLPPAALIHYLSPLDFFSRGGLLHRAQ